MIPPKENRSQKRRRQRADVLLVQRGVCETREKARRLIMAGAVRMGRDTLVGKPGQMLDENVDLLVVARDRYVSRGAWKLTPALRAVPPPAGCVALDIGASTGGFTDALLQCGAQRVYAVDVGRGQLHARLRNDARVICIERCNARYLTPEQVPEAADVLTVDVSFISLKTVLPVLNGFLHAGGAAYLLIKPQFEAGPRHVEKGGVVKNPSVVRECLWGVIQFAEDRLGWRLLALVRPSEKGRTPNEEWMSVFRKEWERTLTD